MKKKNKYTSYLYFLIPIIYFFFINMEKENDIWFLLSHGRYVLSNGFPTHDILSMHSDFSFVMQQWLSSVILYFVYHNLGRLSFYVFLFFINLIILFSLYKLCMIISDNRIFVSVVTSSFIDVLLETNYIVPRPQIFSFIIFILLLIILEKYLKKCEKIIYFIPVLSLVLVNIHASLWPLLFVFCMPYVVELGYYYFKNRSKTIFKLLIILIVSFVVGILNPYGIKAMLYSFTSYGNFLINSLVFEMHPFSLTGNVIIIINSCIILMIFLFSLVLIYIKRDASIHQILLLLGSFLMSLFNLRNSSLYFICSLPFISKYININDYKEKIPYAIYGICVILFTSFLFEKIVSKKYIITNDNEEIVSYLDKNVDRSIKLYTNYNDGSYYEYRGYRPYIDSRAEVFLEINNKCSDIFLEYYDLVNGVIEPKKFIDKYNFSYLVVSSSESLYSYLIDSDDYEFILESNDRYLFSKKDI